MCVEGLFQTFPSLRVTSKLFSRKGQLNQPVLRQVWFPYPPQSCDRDAFGSGVKETARALLVKLKVLMMMMILADGPPPSMNVQILTTSSFSMAAESLSPVALNSRTLATGPLKHISTVELIF